MFLSALVKANKEPNTNVFVHIEKTVKVSQNSQATYSENIIKYCKPPSPVFFQLILSQCLFLCAVVAIIYYKYVFTYLMGNYGNTFSWLLDSF